VAVTFDGTTIRFYVNGTLAGSKARSGVLSDTANPLYLGSYAGSSSRFIGKLDEAQVYNRALTAQEVTTAGGRHAGQHRADDHGDQRDAGEPHGLADEPAVGDGVGHGRPEPAELQLGACRRGREPEQRTTATPVFTPAAR
jgi:hypothetical protein